MTLVSQVVSLARQAGDAIMEIYARDDHGTTQKADDSPLTLADRASHDVIVAGLIALDPAIPILSEESEDVPYADRSGWDPFWLVDPLDGTKEFIKRNGEFTVNIALIRGRTPVLGVVHAPALGVTYWASPGDGAFKQDGTSAARPIRVADYRESGLRVVASRSHAGELMPQLPRGARRSAVRQQRQFAEVLPRRGRNRDALSAFRPDDGMGRRRGGRGRRRGRRDDHRPRGQPARLQQARPAQPAVCRRRKPRVPVGCGAGVRYPSARINVNARLVRQAIAAASRGMWPRRSSSATILAVLSTTFSLSVSQTTSAAAGSS